jgi:hypothetical protein
MITDDFLSRFLLFFLARRIATRGGSCQRMTTQQYEIRPVRISEPCQAQIPCQYRYITGSINSADIKSKQDFPISKRYAGDEISSVRTIYPDFDFIATPMEIRYTPLRQILHPILAGSSSVYIRCARLCNFVKPQVYCHIIS